MSADADEAGEFLDLMRTVRALHRALLDVGEAVAAAGGLTHARAQCLRQIAAEPLTVARIAARLELSRQGVQRVADQLAEEGHAAYVDDPRDRRAKLLDLTPLGRRALADLDAIHHAWMDRAAAELAEIDLADLTVRLRETLRVVVGAPPPGSA